MPVWYNAPRGSSMLSRSAAVWSSGLEQPVDLMLTAGCP